VHKQTGEVRAVKVVSKTKFSRTADKQIHFKASSTARCHAHARAASGCVCAIVQPAASWLLSADQRAVSVRSSLAHRDTAAAAAAAAAGVCACGLRVQELRLEIEILRKMRHDNIITMFDVYETMTELFIVQEICVGGELFVRPQPPHALPQNHAAPLGLCVRSAPVHGAA
jgi:hypothetical protein